MNSIWNKNLELFKKRFPQLSERFRDEIESFKDTYERFPQNLPLRIQSARNGSATALSQDGKPLHSMYNPEREAEQLTAGFTEQDYSAAAFFAPALGYAPLQLAKKFPDVHIILVEPDISRILQAMCTVSWEPLLTHGKITFITGASLKECDELFNRLNAAQIKIYAGQSQCAHAAEYFEAAARNIKNNRSKESANTATLEKFSSLWLRNSCRNLHHIAELDGVKKYFSAARTSAPDIPFVVLAAGPTLEEILPRLKELKDRSVLICVDTALHACLRESVEPDFIVLTDPQYACAMHLAFLKSPSSVLITESSVWPSVFRFECRQKVLCSSMFPLGKYFESRLEEKGALGAGGSVATTAWDFAYSTGTRRIYLAGMDLGFPGKQTHIRGSQFEERAHAQSCRTAPAETQNSLPLFSSGAERASDYNGNTILTDRKMSLFSWWFQTNCGRAEQNGCVTYTLTPRSKAIPGIKTAAVEEILDLDREECLSQKAAFFRTAEESAEKSRSSMSGSSRNFHDALLSFMRDMENLLGLAERGLALTEEALRDNKKVPGALRELSAIDSQILESGAKDAAALVFPTKGRLDSFAESIPKESDMYPVHYSKLVYSELIKAITRYTKELSRLYGQ
ncbi:MAG: motility associated factor glycosyltransferase family protein [Treponema sp.]|nr:motility associated factor glycosyltransferase family protein [Treponema sp.]